MNDTITLPRATVQQALLALEDWWGSFPDFRSLHDKVAIAALRAAMGQQAEPVAVVDEVIHAAWAAGFVEGEKAALEQQAEPVGWLDGNDKLADFMHRDLKAEHDKRGSTTPKDFTIPVYTAPPQRKELSASEILNMMPSTIPAEYDGELMEFARAVEAKTKEGT